MSDYLSTELQIADAALDLIDEVHDVTDPRVMHAQIVKRFATQPDRMAQILMCLAFWAASVPINKLDDHTGSLAVERLGILLTSGDVDRIAEYLEARVDLDAA